MVPRTFYAGDAVEWIDERVPPDATGLTVWFRTNVAGAGFSVSGAFADDVWSVAIPSATTSGMAAGIWQYQSVATTPAGSATTDAGRVEVLASLAFSGTPAAVDSRSQAEIDLEAVEQAIRALSTGAQSYTIGTAAGGRTFTRPMLSQLIAWRDRLLSKVAAERRADGTARQSRRILVRFE
jgi:hypothetical protein